MNGFLWWKLGVLEDIKQRRTMMTDQELFDKIDEDIKNAGLTSAWYSQDKADKAAWMAQLDREWKEYQNHINTTGT